jgi:hypothetical protein
MLNFPASDQDFIVDEPIRPSSIVKQLHYNSCMPFFPRELEIYTRSSMRGLSHGFGNEKENTRYPSMLFGPSAALKDCLRSSIKNLSTRPSFFLELEMFPFNFHEPSQQ